MDIFTISLFGHRAISNVFDVEDKLEKIIRTFIMSKEYVEILVGRSGEFDILAASVVRRVQSALDRANSALVLVLPYMTSEYRKNAASFESYYDEVRICEKSAKAHYKAAMQIRNQCMIDRSDLVICRIEHENGGAFQAVEYAKKSGVPVINIEQNFSSCNSPESML